MVAASGLWYTSATFWTAVGVGATLLGTAAASIVTYMVGFPRQRLLYRLGTVAPLLSAPDRVRTDLELRHRGRLVTDAHVMEIVLIGEGRKDIPRSAFDGGAPMELRVGAPIIDLLQVASEPASIPAPTVQVDGATLAVGPSLIGRRQRITFTVLVEGKPELSCTAPLLDVDVREVAARDVEPVLEVVHSATAVLPLLFARPLVLLLLRRFLRRHRS